MSDFQTLLAAALIGTARTATPSHAGTPLSEPLNQISGRDAEGTLLARAAIAGLAAQAGRQPPQNPQPLPEPAPTETRREAPAQAARHLPLVMDTLLLHEWITLCAQAVWHVPPTHLTELLDRARQDTTLRDLLRPVLGERGAWLVQFNPEWRFTPIRFSENAWDEATDAGREVLYRTLRVENPEAARTLLQTQFSSERAGSRKRLLNVIAQTLSPEDQELEPLLEEALTDRSGDVQELARTILQCLSGSAYNTRMAARWQELVQHENTGLLGKLTGKKKISLHLPNTPDPDLKRDGLSEAKTAQARVEAILSAAHPDALMRAMTCKPDELVHVAQQLNALDELVTATMTTEHTELAALLQPHTKNNNALIRLAAQPHLTTTIQDALKYQQLDLAYDLLQDLPSPWPAELSSDLIQGIRHSIQNAEFAYGWPYQWRNIHDLTRHHAHPHASRAASLPDNAPEFARQTINELNATLDFRKQMWHDFGKGRT